MSVAKVLLSEEQLQKRIKELGQQISKDYAGKSLLCVGILKGSFIFLADLVRQIDVPVSIDFLAVSSYGNSTESSGAVKLLMDLKNDIKDKHVLIVEDIVDTGLTMKYLLDTLGQRKPASLAVCTLLKKDNHQSKIKLDYLAFEIPKDAFVVGYGLDYAEKYRNLPYIGIYQQ
jgi:hypoxanthine phosphoribosyltransferase